MKAIRIPDNPTPVIIGRRNGNVRGNNFRAASEATDAPDSAMAALLAGRLARYLRLYRALRDEFASAD
nr:hypothetical protein [Burkholderia puraquae]